MNNYIVYYHMVPKEISGYEYDKYYFGISKRKNIHDRWGKDGVGYKKQPFYNAIKKYGWNNIHHKILFENLSEEDAISLEMSLISIMNSRLEQRGYNDTVGGDGSGSRSNIKHHYIYCKELNAAFKTAEIASSITGVNTCRINNRCWDLANKGKVPVSIKDDFHFCFIEHMYKMYSEEVMNYASKPVVLLSTGMLYGNRKIAEKLCDISFPKNSILNLSDYLKRKNNNTLYNKERIMYLEDYLKIFDFTTYVK